MIKYEKESVRFIECECGNTEEQPPGVPLKKFTGFDFVEVATLPNSLTSEDYYEGKYSCNDCGATNISETEEQEGEFIRYVTCSNCGETEEHPQDIPFTYFERFKYVDKDPKNSESHYEGRFKCLGCGVGKMLVSYTVREV